MSISVTISNRNIRIISANRRKLVLWDTVALDPGTVKDGNIVRPQALAELLNKLFNQYNLPRGEVTVSMTGMSFIYRILTLPKLKSSEMKEAIERATQKEINVPLEDLYIDWQQTKENADSVEIFVLGVPRTAVEALVGAFKAANIRIAALDLNSLALARTVEKRQALIADFSHDRFDIIIISEGLPVTLHSVAPKGNSLEVEDILTQLNEEIGRTVDFFNLTHKEQPVQAEEPVILSGRLDRKEIGVVLISTYLPQAVGLENHYFSYPEDFPVGEYAVNLGLLLRKRPSGIRNTGTNSHPGINLDLLKGRQQSLKKPIYLKKLLVPACIIAAVALMTPLLLMRNEARLEVNNLQHSLDLTNRDLNLRRTALTQSEETEDLIKSITTEVQNIRDERGLISGKGDLKEMLTVINEGFSEAVQNDGINSGALEITVNGQANKRSEVLAYTDYLVSQKLFSEVRIASIEEFESADAKGTESSSSGVLFNIVLTR